MREESLLTDIVLLALFFLLIYTITYLVMHYSELAEFFHEILSNEATRAVIALLMLPVSIILLTFGIRSMLHLTSSGKLAIGFIFIALGVAILLFSITTVASLIWDIINNLIRVFTMV